MLHEALREYPCKNNVESFGKVNADQQLLLLENPSSINCNYYFKEHVLKILDSIDPLDYKLLFKNPQTIHADLNHGNVVIDKKSHQFIFFDFEDSSSSWMNPYFDLVFVIQRFILSSEKVSHQQLVQAFIQGYCTRQDYFLPLSPGDLFKLYRMISVRSLLILSSMSEESQLHLHTEYSKFILLFDESINHKALFDYAEKLFLTVK